MFASSDDLKVASRSNGQSRYGGDQNKTRIGSNCKQSRPASTASDSADDIQVLEEQLSPIPIRTAPQCGQSDRHSDLDIGSVHTRKRRPSPLFERRKRDDIDLLLDSVDSNYVDYLQEAGPDSTCRGRGRCTKPLLYPEQSSSPHRPQYCGYNMRRSSCFGRHQDSDHSLNDPGSFHETDAGTERVDVCRARGMQHKRSHTSRRTQARVPHAPTPGVEHEAMVFDNFEDGSSASSASEKEQENKDPFDAHLHFVRPAMPICANPGAFVAREPNVTPTRPSKEALNKVTDDKQVRAQVKRHRLGHHRALSELFLSPNPCAKSIDIRASRRRATIGSEAAHRLPSFSRQADLSA